MCTNEKVSKARERLIKTKQNKNKTDGSVDMTGGLLVMAAITEAHSMFFSQFLVSREKPSDKGIKCWC